MKSTLRSLAHAPLILFACLVAGCAAGDESGVIWYDDGESACYAEGDDGEPVEVPCSDVASPPSEPLGDEGRGACQIPDECNKVEQN
jgi:hypothetical protein